MGDALVLFVCGRIIRVFPATSAAASSTSYVTGVVVISGQPVGSLPKDAVAVSAFKSTIVDVLLIFGVVIRLDAVTLLWERETAPAIGRDCNHTLVCCNAPWLCVLCHARMCVFACRQTRRLSSKVTRAVLRLVLQLGTHRHHRTKPGRIGMRASESNQGFGEHSGETRALDCCLIVMSQ